MAADDAMKRANNQNGCSHTMKWRNALGETKKHGLTGSENQNIHKIIYYRE